MKVHEVTRTLSRALRVGRRLRRQARIEGRRKRTHRCIAFGAFVYAFPLFAQPGRAGLPTLRAFMAFMPFMVKDLCSRITLLWFCRFRFLHELHACERQVSRAVE